jgi:two-component system, OmpR family, sensor histidine kinase MprB
MSFRARLVLVSALAVAAAVVAASALTYVLVRDELRGEVDDALRSRAATARLRIVQDPESGRRFLDVPPPAFGGAPGYTQLVTESGSTIRPFGELAELPVSARARRAAAGSEDAFFADAHVSGTHVRVLTLPLEHGYALQIARPLDEVDHALARIRNWLLLIAAFGVVIAAALGLLVARAVLTPIRRLTRTAEEVTETRDLSRRIEVDGRDEVSRLASSFNTMLAALEDSSRAQRQLVSDASHELRTPLTSLRTNIEVLARDDELPGEEREQLLLDVTEQLTEMTALVAELVELARGDREPAEAEDVRLDLVVAGAIERTTRNRPGVSFRPRLEASLVRGVPATIERAVSNLLDNAAKWSPPGGEVEVAVNDGEVVVRDHGPGIDAEDAPYVFDRFYRAANARGMPGSGLGLAIVRQVAESHGGTVSAEAAEGGGTRMRLSLPRASEPVPPGS